MPDAKYLIRICFDRDGCLWPGNEATVELFERTGIGLSLAILERVNRLRGVYDTSWDNGCTRFIPWTEAQVVRFNNRVRAIMQDMRAELGSDFNVEYDEQW